LFIGRDFPQLQQFESGKPTDKKRTTNASQISEMCKRKSFKSRGKPWHSPNIDGIHVTETQNIQIHKCVIRPGIRHKKGKKKKI
jgi:hypothetical protein